MPLPSLDITILQGAFFPVPPVRGGAVEKLWHRMALEFARKGHRVTQISRAVPELPLENHDQGVHHLRVKGYDQPKSGLSLKWRDFLYTRRALSVAPSADILITNTFFSPLLAAAHLGKIYVSVERMPKGQMRFYRRAARLRACSQAVADAIKREAPKLASKIEIIPNPLPFVPADFPSLSEEKNGLLYVGRIHPAKGLEMLLKAFIHAKRKRLIPSDCPLTLVGPASVGRGGGGETWWRELLAENADSGIRWLGPIYDHAALNEQYQKARVFVYPSLDDGESFGLAPLEAMAWGCVPIVSNLACFRDYLTPHKNGFVFDHRAADPVQALGASIALALSPTGQALAPNATAVRSTHSPSSIADLFIEDFVSLDRSESL